MDFLDQNFSPKAEDFNLDSILASQTVPPSIPQGSLRNRAATVSLLSPDPTKAVENYDMLMKEGKEGGNAVYDQIKDNIMQSTKKMDIQTIMTVLADPSVSLETKNRAIADINSPEMQDSTNILYTNALAAPSAGESPKQEDTRIFTANNIRAIQKSRIATQGLVNAHAATLDIADLDTLGEAFGLDVVPFGTAMSAEGVMRSFKEGVGEKVSVWDVIKATLAPGHSIAETRAKLESFPIERRHEINKIMLKAINSSSGIIFPADNHYAEARKLEQMFSEGGYSDTEKWLDSVAGLLDVVGMGFTVRTGSKALKGAKEAAKVHPAKWELVDEVAPKGTKTTKPVAPTTDPRVAVADRMDRIELNSTIRKENPSSPANVMQQANPEKARNAHATVVRASTDEPAEALYGVSKEQAIINDVMPQMVTESGAVTAKVVDIDRNLRVELQIDDDVTSLIYDTGAIHYSDAEKAQVRANFVRKFDDVEGVVPHDAEASFSVVGGRIKLDGMYGTSEGGFSDAADAVAQTKFAMRGMGVVDSDITIMKREGLDYVPTTLQEVDGIAGDYKVRISTFREISANDIEDAAGNVSFEKLITKRNWTDSVRLSMSDTQGTLTRSMFDAASVIDPRVAGASSVAVDQGSRFEKIMLQKAAEFSDKMDVFDASSKAAIFDYLKEANYKRIKFDTADLVGRGFNPEEIDAIHSWRKFWDHAFYLENHDAVRSLNAQGYQLFNNANTTLYAKPVSKNKNIGLNFVYDPSVNDIVKWGEGETDILYAAGGTYARLRRPTDFNGTVVDHMIIRNTPTEYSRTLRDTDSVMNYIDGYYQVQYQKNAKFVDETMYDVAGKKTGVKTIAVAGDTAEAMLFAKNMAGSTGKSVLDFHVRGDVNGLRRNSDEWWDLASSSGRIAQRHRGKLLEDASGINHLGDGSYVVSPVDSAVRAARSISGRTVMRPMLEAARARFLHQFEAVIPKENGVTRMPRNLNEIGQKGEPTNKLVRDARTNFEHIKYLENGYMNLMDDFIKQGMNAAGTVLGEVSKKTMTKYPKSTKAISLAERAALRASEIALSGQLKGAVFTATIVSNVFRQWIVQPHQVLRTMAYNPKGWMNGAVQKLIAGYTLEMGGLWGRSPAMNGVFEQTFGVGSKHVNAKDFTEFVDNSGLLASVDKSNLVRGTLLNAADSGNKVVQAIAKYTTTPARMAGFDLGEMANLLGHAAAVYERRIRNGADLKDLAQRDAAYAEIRAISGAMNAAGDMPYNQNLLGPLLQFAQVPQKMYLVLTNRMVDVPARLRMIGFDWVMWGSPAAAIAAYMGKDILPDDPVNREMFVNGIESAMLNHMLGGFDNINLKTDFRSLDPHDVSGWFKFHEALAEGGYQKVILNSPAGQLFLKDGGKIQNAIGHVARFFGATAELDQTPETAIQVVSEVAQVLSGVSNFTKAKLILETGKAVNKSGKVMAEGLGSQSALLQLFGFPPTKAGDLFESIDKINMDLKAHKEAITQDYNEIVRYMASVQNLDTDDAGEWNDRVVAAVLRVHGDDPTALTILNGLLKRDLHNPDSTMYTLFAKRVALAHGKGEFGGLEDQVKLMNTSDENKKAMFSLIEDAKQAFKEDRERRE